MLKNELIELLKDIDEDGNIDEILQQTHLYKSSLSLDNFKRLIGNDKDFKSFFDSEKDKHYTKGLETWKANNLNKLVEAEVLKRTGKSETPEQKALRELQEKFNAMEKANKTLEIKNKFKDILAEKGLNDFSDFLLNAEDEEVINANISLFESKLTPIIEKGVNTRLGTSSHTPKKGTTGGKITWEQVNENPALMEQYFKEQE